ncbi:MAG: DUF1810 family protein [Byssovorax sp.]
MTTPDPFDLDRFVAAQDGDAVKLRSSMTLFKVVGGAGEPFAECLDRYFGGAEDEATRSLLAGAGAL